MGPIEVKGTGIQFIRHHKRVDSVMEHKSSHCQQKKGEKQCSSGHGSYPQT